MSLNTSPEVSELVCSDHPKSGAQTHLVANALDPSTTRPSGSVILRVIATPKASGNQRRDESRDWHWRERFGVPHAKYLNLLVRAALQPRGLHL